MSICATWPERSIKLSVPQSPGIDHLKSATSVLVQEAQRLVHNATDCQASMRKLQRELKRLRLS
jgi:hypothetical protein